MVAETATQSDLTELLEYVYSTTRATVMADPRDFKEVYAWVYVSEKRAKAGNGEWIAMIKETGEGRLPERTTPSFQLPDPKAEKPTPQEDEIYDAFWDALNKDDSPDAEERIKRELARRYKKKPKDIDRIYLKVYAYRH